ncbi:phage tail-like protein [Paenibacillus mucilaginosus]|uniref:phage tail protein n=1 Tax=Paenibacillus mucilaginosus TaxID=61624 RepID=UPI003D22F184
MRPDPIGAFRFKVDIIGLKDPVGFTAVSGLQVETEYEEYREGGQNDYVHRFPKRSFSPALIFKKGVTGSLELWNWYYDVVNGMVVRRDGSVTMYGPDGTGVCQWVFHHAYPVKWAGADLDAQSGSIAIESIEFVHTGLRMERVPKRS